MSNPYDPSGTPPEEPSNPYGQYGQTPYGQPQYGQSPYGQAPYGQTPYGSPAPFGNEPGRSTDAVSIIGFVLSLTCCLSVVGAILGFVGLSRTKNGQRKGRWAAIAASIIGVLGTLALVAIIVGIVLVARNVVTPGNAEAGECLNVDHGDSSTVTLTKKSCTDSHDAEVVYAGEAGSDSATLENGEFQDICASRAGASYQSVFDSGDYLVQAAFDDPDNVDSSDKFICYIEPKSGEKLTDQLGT